MSNQELITNTTNPIALSTESCVKFDGKISTSDLIEAVLFETEENLSNSLNALESQYKNLLKQEITLVEQKEKIYERINKQYYKKYNSLIKQLELFYSSKVEVSSEIIRSSSKTSMEIDITIYNSKVDLSKRVKENMPKDLSENMKQINILKKNISENLEKIDNISDCIKRLPMVKKKIKTEFIKSIIKGDNLSAKDMLQKLREAVLSYNK